ncbi:MAG: hypothetical protein M3Z19_07760 [Chloroflexota bacterium]|nr:hypothetical protein [Chloroflexota bacterium]
MSHQALTLTGDLDDGLTLTQPLPIVAEWRDEYVTINAPAVGLRTMGQSPEDALDDLRAAIADRYRDLDGRGPARTPSAEDELAALKQYVAAR